MGVPSKIRQMQVEARKRRQRVRDYLLRGITSCAEISVALGIRQETIANDLHFIFESWMTQDIRATRKKRAYRVKQLEFAAHKAILSFERSRQDQEEYQTVATPVPCPECRGTGSVGPEGEEWCSTCDGSGRVLNEVVTHRVKGQAGDSSFLRTYIDSIKEIAKLEVLYPRTSAKPVRVEGKVLHAHVHGGIDFSKVSAEAILEAKRAHARLLGTANGEASPVDNN